MPSMLAGLELFIAGKNVMDMNIIGNKGSEHMNILKLFKSNALKILFGIIVDSASCGEIIINIQNGAINIVLAAANILKPFITLSFWFAP